MSHLERLRFNLEPALVLVVALSPACGNDVSRDAVTFTDGAASAGLTVAAVCGNEAKEHLLESTGTGVAVADYDLDGDDDLYLATAQTTSDWMADRRSRANVLYRNDGDGTFTDVAVEAGVDLAAWSAGGYFIDYDNDGDQDLFVTTWGPNVLYRNDGDGTFTDVTVRAGVSGNHDAWSASAAFGDLDADGDLDLYVTNYTVYDLDAPPFGGSKSMWQGMAVYPGPRGFTAQADTLYRNDGDGTFTDVSTDAGILAAAPLYGLGVVMSDLDDDGDLDIFVANDSVSNSLFRNDGELRFTEIGAFANVATNEDAKDQAGMGTDAGDQDGDGRPDLVVTNFSHDCNTLHRNQGNLFFTDATFEAGLRDSYLKLGWGVKFLDYDNDGNQDVLAVNGHIYPEIDGERRLNSTYRQANSLYRNRGDGVLEDVTERSGPGLAVIESSRGLAVVDIDRDGDLDAVATNIDSKPTLLINEGGNRASWVSFTLRGVESNRDAVGARITIDAGGRTQVREVNPFGSYLSRGSAAAHFGLAEADIVDRVVVRWPSGRSEELLDVPARMFHVVTEGSGVTSSVPPGRSGR